MISLRKILCLLTVSGLFLTATSATQAAEAWITVDAKTGFVLEKFQAEKKRQIGSVTKIATAMVVLDWAAKEKSDLAQVAVIPEAAFVGISENSVGFQPGDTITLRDLLYAALVQSDNIAAYTLADHVGRTLQMQLPPSGEAARGTPVDYFVLQMNALAKHLGMVRTRFLNPSGQDANEKPYSTAADVARLTRYAM